MTGSRCLLVVGVTLALVAAPVGVQAEPAKVPRVGLLESSSLAARAPLWEAFRQAMRELGYVEGRSVVFEARGTAGGPAELPAPATDLVRLRVDAISTRAEPYRHTRAATRRKFSPRMPRTAVSP
jgi:putative ABC transport system substrate-binding protein